MKREFRSRCLGTLVGALCPIAIASPALAQELALEEVIVTAQKREQSLSDVPFSVSVITGDQLVASRVTTIVDLQSSIPNVSIGTDFGQAKIFIRGIGNVNPFAGVDPSIAMHVDGTYISYAGAQLGSFFDLERIEVLRGPQGSLYGRNATGGSINLITNKPTEALDGYVRGSFGNYNEVIAEAAIGGPLLRSGEGEPSRMLGRLAISSNQRDGYGTNEIGGRDIDDANKLYGRGHLQFNFTDDLDLLLSVESGRQDDAAYVFHYLSPDGTTPTEGVPPASNYQDFVSSDPRNIRADYPKYMFDWKTTAAWATLNWDFAEDYSLKFLSYYRDFSVRSGEDLDGSSMPWYTNREANVSTEARSQELQLNFNRGRLAGVVGLFYYEEDIGVNSGLGLDPTLAVKTGQTGLTCIPFGPPGPFVPPATCPMSIYVYGNMDVEAWAAYANVNVSMNEQWSLTLGARYSDESRTKQDIFEAFMNPQTTDYRGEWDDFSPTVRVEWSRDSEMMLYAGYSSGFKSGGGSLGQIQGLVNPETVDSYEIGMKASLFDRRVALNAAAFYARIHDMQLNKTLTNPAGGFGSLLVNAAEAEALGLEVEATWLVTENFQLQAMLGLMHTEFLNYEDINPLDPCAGGTPGCDPNVPSTAIPQDFSGNRLVQSPEETGSLQGDYRIGLANGGNIVLSGEVAYKGMIYFTPFNESNLKQDGVTLVNAFVRYNFPGERLRAELWGRNLTDELYYGSKFPVSTTRSIQGTPGPPRTYGIGVSYSF